MTKNDIEPRTVSEAAPYELPAGWKWCRLGEVFSINPRVQADDALQASFVPMEKIEPDNKNMFSFSVEQWGKIKRNHTQFTDGDVCFAKISPCFENGKAFIARGLENGIGAGTTELIVLRNSEINSKYTFYFISNGAFIRKGRATYSGTVGQQRINMDFVKSYPFPLPPTLAEQQRIVSRIESLFTKLDEAKDKAQSVLDGFELRRAAVLHKAFTGELTAKWRKEHGVSDDSWEEKTIGECCKLGSGGTPSKRNPEYYENGTLSWLKTGEIDWNDIYDTEEKITEEGMNNSSAKIYPAESVVVAMYGMGVTRGKTGILKQAMTTNQAVCVLQPDNSLFNRYLFYYFMCNYWTFREKAVGGNQLNYSATMIGKWEINLPPLPEQQEIVRILDTVLEKEADAKEAAQSVLDQIALLKKSILSRAFRGEL